MKVVHIIKKIETIDEDIKELKKLEKSLQRDKSFSTPIYMTIEKQINLMLGERIKLLELKIQNPPEELVKEIEGEQVLAAKPAQLKEEPKIEKKQKSKKAVKTKSVAKKDLDDDSIPLLTQDLIDAKFSAIKAEKEKSSPNDDNVKLLDIALEKGSLEKKEMEKEKKVKFFRDNFPIE